MNISKSLLFVVSLVLIFTSTFSCLPAYSESVTSTMLERKKKGRKLFKPRRYELNLKITELEVCNLVTGICGFEKTDDRATFLIEFGKKTARGQVIFTATNETQKRKSVAGRATLFSGEANFFIPYEYELEEPDGIFTYQVDLECIGNLTSKKRRISGLCISKIGTEISGTPATITVSGPFEASATKRKPSSTITNK